MKEIRRFENLKEEIKLEVRNSIKEFYKNLHQELIQESANKKEYMSVMENDFNFKNWIMINYF